MFDGLFITSLIGSVVDVFKEKTSKEIPAENWANRDLLHEDMAKGVSVEQQIKYAEQGRYKKTYTHPEPHRDPVDGKIIIENSTLYNHDCMNYSGAQVGKWVEEGKYNLSPERLEEERRRFREEMDRLYSL